MLNWHIRHFVTHALTVVGEVHKRRFEAGQHDDVERGTQNL